MLQEHLVLQLSKPVETHMPLSHVKEADLLQARELTILKYAAQGALRGLACRQCDGQKHWKHWRVAIDETKELMKLFYVRDDRSPSWPSVNCYTLSRLMFTTEALELLFTMGNLYFFWLAVENAAAKSSQLPIEADTVKEVFRTIADALPCPPELRFKPFSQWTVADVQANLNKGGHLLEISGHTYDFRYLLNPLLQWQSPASNT